MKKLLGVATTLALASAAFAQGPYSMSIGSGTGSLTITAGATAGAYSNGMILGDTAVFNSGSGAAGSTIWKTFFLLRNDTDNENYWCDNTAAHTTKLPAGTLANTPTSITNSNFAMTAAGQTGSLAMTLSQPTPGDTAKINWAWTINNGTAAAKNYRIVFHFDADSYIGSNNYADDFVSRAPNTMAGGSVVGFGEGNGAGAVDLNNGILIESSVAPTSFFGLSSSSGPSNWWSNASGYTPNGVEATNSIAPIYANTVQNDANTNFVSDAGEDSGGALQVDFAVPANGATTVNLAATWGLNQLLTGAAPVSDWELY